MGIKAMRTLDNLIRDGGYGALDPNSIGPSFFKGRKTLKLRHSTGRYGFQQGLPIRAESGSSGGVLPQGCHKGRWTRARRLAWLRESARG